jgi:hypothetical protein
MTSTWASITKMEKPQHAPIPSDCIQIASINVKKQTKGKWHKVDTSSLNFQLPNRPIIVIQKKSTEQHQNNDISNQTIKRVIIVDDDGFVSITRK